MTPTPTTPGAWRNLREAAPPPIDRVRRRVRRRVARRALFRVAALVCVVATVGVGVVGGRDRGGAGTVPLVAIDAVAEGASGPRGLADGAEVGPDERVVFFVRSSIDGVAEVREGPDTVVLSWPIAAGDNAVGGATPLSWRPDGPLGVQRYEVTVCPTEGATTGCASDGLTLRWR